MFLEQGIKPKNKFWKYLLGSVLIILGFSIGQILINLVVIFAASLNHTSKLPKTANQALGYLPANATLSLMIITYIVALVAIYFVFRYLHRQTWKSVTTSRVKTDWKRMGFGFGISALYWIAWYSALVYFWPQEQTFIFKPVPFIIYFCILIILTFARSLTEQSVYFGYLIQGFANLSTNRWFPLLMVSIISSLIYATHPEISAKGFFTMFLYQLIYSIFLGILTLMDEGIELAVGFHTATIFINQCFFTSEYTAIKTNSLFMTLDDGSNDDSIDLRKFIGRLIIFTIFLFICQRKYKWQNWREKLTGKISTDYSII